MNFKGLLGGLTILCGLSVACFAREDSQGPHRGLMQAPPLIIDESTALVNSTEYAQAQLTSALLNETIATVILLVHVTIDDIHFSAPLPTINRTVSIAGNCDTTDSKCVIDGQGLHRLFTVDGPAGRLRLTNLYLTGGFSAANASTLFVTGGASGELVDCEVRGGLAGAGGGRRLLEAGAPWGEAQHGGGEGGGIGCLVNGTLTLQDSLLVNNSANRGGAVAAVGASCTVHLLRVRLESNRADLGGGVFLGDGAAGAMEGGAAGGV
ncbi:hypothetical protein CYMTET_31964, partial [Cymbomonas tetramitiformis]